MLTNNWNCAQNARTQAREDKERKREEERKERYRARDEEERKKEREREERRRRREEEEDAMRRRARDTRDRWVSEDMHIPLKRVANLELFTAFQGKEAQEPEQK